MVRSKVSSFGVSWAVGLLFLVVDPSFASSGKIPGYPRLFGMNIGEKNYQSETYQKQLSKLDVDTADEGPRVVQRLRELGTDV